MMGKRKERKIEITLFEEDRGYGYNIHVGGTHACSGCFIDSSVSAYLLMLQQLLFNAPNFHKKCPRPHSSNESPSVENNITDEERKLIDESKIKTRLKMEL